jgi:hypothetical protein
MSFAGEFIAYFIVVANTRAFTQGHYLWTAVTDFLFSLQSFVVAKLMVDHKELRTWSSGLGMACGGTCGSLLSIYVTKHLYGA